MSGLDDTDAVNSTENLPDTEYEWKVDKETLKMIENANCGANLKHEAPDTFYSNDNASFCVKLTPYKTQIELYLYLLSLADLNNMFKSPGEYLCKKMESIKIDKVNVILVPFDTENKRKVWRAKDIMLGTGSSCHLVYHRWRFKKDQMLKWLETHSLKIELKGIHFAWG